MLVVGAQGTRSGKADMGRGSGLGRRGVQVRTSFRGVLNAPLVCRVPWGHGELLWGHCGEKVFFRKLTLRPEAAYTEGYPLARRPVRACWNPHRT